ncbi:hypothetical protein [Nostoc favosum]|uniref:Uncharacterized protein n=1 Tax=Nostoc favosum CHAB5714 TaxID=2780399 RepID=A0ABS8ICU9_9NOSO|nr:hypothetical protein [Nostoc favosum]MCC5601588.1 hypothetical protein [Nostoc favosum CHAB5714]
MSWVVHQIDWQRTQLTSASGLTQLAQAIAYGFGYFFFSAIANHFDKFTLV